MVGLLGKLGLQGGGGEERGGYGKPPGGGGRGGDKSLGGGGTGLQAPSADRPADLSTLLNEYKYSMYSIFTASLSLLNK